jgi:hypothetical protein
MDVDHVTLALLVVTIHHRTSEFIHHRFAGDGEATQYGYLHVTSDTQFKNLTGRMSKEDRNLLLICGKNVEAQWLNDIASTSEANSRHPCYITPQFGTEPVRMCWI